MQPLLLNTGQLRMPLRHQSPAVSNDTHGAPITNWLDRGLVWGVFERTHASAKDREAGREAERTAQVLARHRSANPLKAGDRLVSKRVWQVDAVIDPDGTERFVRAYCTSYPEDQAE